MIKNLFNWLDQRTGYRKIYSVYCQRPLPEGPRWSMVTTSCMFWMMLVVAVTGCFLATGYSASTNTAWGSVFFMQQMPLGSFVRGIHYWGTHVLIVLFALHMIRMLLTASYRNSRDLMWITSILLFSLVVVMAVTGNPLSGTQKGFAQIEVEGNIAGSIPLVGPPTQKMLIGGDSVGNLTMTRLNFLHVVFLPLLIVLLTLFYFYQDYRNALAAHENIDPALPPPDDIKTYWPHQSLRNAIAVLVLLLGIAYLAYQYAAPLEAPVDPEIQYSPRPEWYFYSLFELRRYFPGQLEFIATAIIPGTALLLLLALPLLDKRCNKKISLILRSIIVVGGCAAWTALTMATTMRDYNDEEHQKSLAENEKLAHRAIELAERGIPPEGATSLLRNDPKTQGPILFAQHCASCHSHSDQDDNGIVSEDPSAPNLYGFADRTWVAAILDPDKFGSDHYFGKTKFTAEDTAGDMVDGQVDNLNEKQIEQVVAALAAEAKLKSLAEQDKIGQEKIKKGIALLKDTDGCAMCHKFHEVDEEYEAPDLTGYGSRKWIIDFISNPGHSRFYGENNDRMPAYAKHPDKPADNLLSRKNIEILADWIRGEWYEPDAAKKEDE